MDLIEVRENERGLERELRAARCVNRSISPDVTSWELLKMSARWFLAETWAGCHAEVVAFDDSVYRGRVIGPAHIGPKNIVLDVLIIDVAPEGLMNDVQLFAIPLNFILNVDGWDFVSGDVQPGVRQ